MSGTLLTQLDPPVPELIRATAAAAGGEPAVLHGEREWSYEQLLDAVESTAASLSDAGVQRGELIALCSSRCPELLFAVLACFELGAAVVPLHVNMGEEQVASIVQRLAPRLVLADAESHQRLPGALALEDLASPATAQNPARVRTKGLLACVLHTSGTTGTAKSVALSHRALTNRIVWGQELYPLAPGDVVLHQAVPIFDFALWEMLAPLCFGAAVAIAPSEAEADPAELARLLREHEVTAAHFVPSLLADYMSETAGAELARLRYLFCGGEALPAQLLARVRQSTSAAVFNQYGPAEATIDCTAWRVPDAWSDGPVPIGAPIAGTTAYVLDNDLAPTGESQPGVLHVGGECLAWGYHGQPRETAEAFMPDPFSSKPGGRMFRTGDLAIWRDGLLEFAGRSDEQVKIRGVRIEPAAVEHALLSHPRVLQAAVVRVAEQDEVRLEAHFVASPPDLSHVELRRHLAARLPAAAVPEQLTSHPSLPRLASGKLDRASLLAPRPESSPAAPADVPASATEAELIEMWKTLLGVEQVGPQEDFFALGGHSLLAMRLMARMRAAFGVRLPARTIFDSPTVQALAGLIDEARAEAAP